MKKAKDSARTASEQVTKDRQKKTGEVFSPTELILKMLDQVDPDLFQPR